MVTEEQIFHLLHQELWKADAESNKARKAEDYLEYDHYRIVWHTIEDILKKIAELDDEPQPAPEEEREA